MQGMCDLAAPLLVMMREEAHAHALFNSLMRRATDNFPSGQAMDAHFADMRSVLLSIFCKKIFRSNIYSFNLIGILRLLII